MASATDAMKTQGKNWARQLSASGCEYFYFKTDCRTIVLLIGPLNTGLHPAGIAFNSDWTVKSFITVVHDKLFCDFSQKFLSKVRVKKMFSWTTITKL